MARETSCGSEGVDVILLAGCEVYESVLRLESAFSVCIKALSLSSCKGCV